LTVFTPPQYAGTVDVTVTTAAGVSNPNSNARFSYSAAAAPAITSLSTSSGTSTGGNTITLTGTNFTGATAVYFGTVAANFTLNSDTSISVIVPPQAAGTVDVTVATYSGTSATSVNDQYTYTASAGPVVLSLTTSSGTSSGGTLVTLTGSGFTAATSVLFGSVAAPNFTINSDSSLSVWTPAQASGSVNLTVTTPNGTSTPVSFTYNSASAPSVTGLSPSTGPTTGGNTIVVQGSGFTSASSVSVGGVNADFTVQSDTAIAVTVPVGTAGTVDVVVTTPSGTSNIVTADEYTYTNVTAPAPAVAPTAATPAAARPCSSPAPISRGPRRSSSTTPTPPASR
jgi:hypothetical protein